LKFVEAGLGLVAADQDETRGPGNAPAILTAKSKDFGADGAT
jgi:hypothetical protein